MNETEPDDDRYYICPSETYWDDIGDLAYSTRHYMSPFNSLYEKVDQAETVHWIYNEKTGYQLHHYSYQDHVIDNFELVKIEELDGALIIKHYAFTPRASMLSTSTETGFTGLPNQDRASQEYKAREENYVRESALGLDQPSFEDSEELLEALKTFSPERIVHK